MLSRMAALIGAVVFWTWAIVRLALDWIGRSTVVDDYNQLVERLPNWLEWLFTTPWWVPSGLATILTVILIWAIWPRKTLRTLTLQQAREAGIIAPPPTNVAARVLLRYGHDEIPEKVMAENIHRYFSLTFHIDAIGVTPEGQQQTSSKQIATALFLVFDSSLTARNLRVKFEGPRKPRYDIRDFDDRSAVIVFFEPMDGIFVDVEAYH
jgi:hypothetical protein